MYFIIFFYYIYITFPKIEAKSEENNENIEKMAIRQVVKHSIYRHHIK